MLQIVQAYDRTPFAELPTDDAAALERKLAAAADAFRDRDARLPPHARIAILQKVARHIAEQRDHFSRQIAREGGKSLTDARIEVDRAVDGGLPPFGGPGSKLVHRRSRDDGRASGRR